MNSKLKDYLNLFRSKEIGLIGPLFQQEEEVLLNSNNPLIYIDTNELKNYPGFKIGDGDSSVEQMDILLNQKKDFSDLSFTLSQLSNEYLLVKALGFLGERKDHELINFGEFFHFLEKRKNTQIILNNEIKLYSSGNWEIELTGIFSLLFLKCRFLKLEGKCQYQFSGTPNYPLSSQFLSNRANGKVFLACDMPMAIVTPK